MALDSMSKPRKAFADIPSVPRQYSKAKAIQLCQCVFFHQIKPIPSQTACRVGTLCYRQRLKFYCSFDCVCELDVFKDSTSLCNMALFVYFLPSFGRPLFVTMGLRGHGGQGRGRPRAFGRLGLFGKGQGTQAILQVVKGSPRFLNIKGISN